MSTGQATIRAKQRDWELIVFLARLTGWFTPVDAARASGCFGNYPAISRILRNAANNGNMRKRTTPYDARSVQYAWPEDSDPQQLTLI